MRSFLIALMAAVPTALLVMDYIQFQRVQWWLMLVWIIIMVFAIALTFGRDDTR